MTCYAMGNEGPLLRGRKCRDVVKTRGGMAFDYVAWCLTKCGNGCTFERELIFCGECGRHFQYIEKLWKFVNVGEFKCAEHSWPNCAVKLTESDWTFFFYFVKILQQVALFQPCVDLAAETVCFGCKVEAGRSPVWTNVSFGTVCF